MYGGFPLDFLRDRVNDELTSFIIMNDAGCCSSTHTGPKFRAALGCTILHGNAHFNALALHEGFWQGSMV